MQQQITEALTPLILAVITALAAIAIATINSLKGKVIAWIESHTTANQQAIIDRVAQEAYAYTEKWAKEYGQEKLAMAAEYIAKELKAAGIDVPAEKIQAAAQAAWQQQNTYKY